MGWWDEVERMIMDQNKKIPISRDATLEHLADLSHEQWVFWSQSICSSGKVPKDVCEEWKRHWMPYFQLDEPVKELDREFARKVLDCLERLGIVSWEK